jgi:hypothetical protein
MDGHHIIFRITAVGAALAAGAGATATACGDDGDGDGDGGGAAPAAEPVIDVGDGGRYDPGVGPGDFVAGVDNPYLPFRPGERWAYEGTADGEVERIEVTVTGERREVMGVPVVVVRDTVTVAGELVEDTRDWYAQDCSGNVWYLGEDTAEYEDGEVVSTAGSWEAGVDGARPGIVMQAHPEVGQAYRQEYYPGEAEDLAEVVEVGATKAVALGEYDDVVVIEEWNPLEPDVVEDKFYAPGVGAIAEEKVAGGDEVVELKAFSGAT